MLSSSATATNIANESADREWAERIGRERFEFPFRIAFWRGGTVRPNG